MPTVYFLIGVPASGKSTWVENFILGNDSIVLSTDNYIEDVAKSRGLTYNDVFTAAIKDAEKSLNEALEWGIKFEKNLVWDQTNLNEKNRRKKLSKIPAHYRKVAVCFPTPDPDEHARRLNNRPGKTIPEFVLKNMISSLAFPDSSEGFDEIQIIEV